MEDRETFSSWKTVLLAALAVDVGSGNIWRFPRMAAANGGGAFIVTWLCALFLWSIPIIIIEYGLGRGTRLGIAGAFGRLHGKGGSINPRYNWVGLFIGSCTVFIMFYYSVICGWSFKYFLSSFSGSLYATDSQLFWDAFTSGYEPVVYHFAAVLMSCLVVWFGIQKGIERVNRVMVPGLFLLLVVSAVNAIGLEGSGKGLEFLFNPDWGSLLKYQVWLQGLSQSAWSIGPGWGLILTMGVYVKKREDIVLNSFMTGLGNNSASLLAGIAVLCTLFSLLPEGEALNVASQGNFGLTFVWIPKLFMEMRAGSIFGTVFFLGLSFATLSSLIIMILLAANVLEDLGLKRKKGVVIVGIATFVVGLPSAVSVPFLENQDWVWGLGLLIGGVLTAVSAAKYGIRNFQKEFINTVAGNVRVGKWHEVVVRYLIPIEFFVLIVWWFYQSVTAYDPDGWYNPLRVYSVATCLVQWALVLFVIFLSVKWISAKVLNTMNARNSSGGEK